MGRLTHLRRPLRALVVVLKHQHEAEFPRAQRD
jgi:hypothetical protein